MAVDTKKVENRRELKFESYEEMLVEAERLAAGEVTLTGNWTLGQILQHLAKSMDAAIDGMEMKVPWFMKLVFGLMMNKDKMMNQTVPAGYKIPKAGESQFMPDSDISTEDGLQALRTAVERSNAESSRSPHPIFGDLTKEEWDTFNLRHAELHLSFVELA